MLSTIITIKLIVFIGAVLAAFFTGLLFKKAQVAALRERIRELDEEVHISHAEILELQQRNGKLASDSNHAIPVIPLKSKEESSHKNLGGK